MAFLRKARAVLARKLGAMSSSSEFFGPPKGICHSVRDWCHQNGFCYSPGNPSEAGAIPESLFTATMRDCRVYGDKTVGVINANDQVFAELTVAKTSWVGSPIEDHRLFRVLLMPKVHHLKGTTALLAMPGGNTYYHWMTEVMPRLEIIRSSGIALDSIDTFIVNSRSRAFQKETLSHLNILPKCIGLDEHAHIKAEWLIAPALPGIQDQPDLWALAFLRRVFKVEEPAAADDGNHCDIYISRARARNRGIANETEVRRLLEHAGFVPVCLEELTVTEQARLFARAKTVIGPHGSGFTNIVFAMPHTRVIEIFPDGSPMPAYFKNMAETLNLKHEQFTADLDQQSHGKMKVSLKKLENFLENRI